MSVQKKIFLYSLKVWLTSVLLAPVLFLIIDLLSGSKIYTPIGDVFFVLLLIVVVGGMMSFATWLAFLAVMAVTFICVEEGNLRKAILSIAGVLLTVATFVVFDKGVLRVDSDFFYLMIANCMCIVVGVWIYKIDINGKMDIRSIY